MRLTGEPKKKINQWGTVARGGPFDAPELYGIAVAGEYFDEEKQRVRYIETSRVVDAEGNRVLTQSGSLYELGDPHPDFLAALTKMGRTFDPENPIKVVRS